VRSPSQAVQLRTSDFWGFRPDQVRRGACPPSQPVPAPSDCGKGSTLLAGHRHEGSRHAYDLFTCTLWAFDLARSMLGDRLDALECLPALRATVRVGWHDRPLLPSGCSCAPDLAQPPRGPGTSHAPADWRPRAIIWLEPLHLCRSLIELATSDRVPNRALLWFRRRHLRGNFWRPPDLSIRLFLIHIDLRHLWRRRRSPDDDRFAKWIARWPARRARHHLGESAMSVADRQRRSCGDH
jgi:hypothetical protein